MAEKSYLQFALNEELSKGKKTSVWFAGSGTSCLGMIKWYAPWRRYCYFPTSDILMDSGCLKEVTRFIDAEMLKRKK